MENSKAHIIAQLQREILPLQGFKSPGSKAACVDLGVINDVFPDNRFPTGVIHEFISTDREGVSSSAGFIAGILGMLMKDEGVVLWISSAPLLFPPTLSYFGIHPSKVIVVNVPKEKDLLWATEEALKCEGLAAVLVEMRELDFTASRRLQLIVERSGVTGFILRQNPRKLGTTAAVTRWKITSLSSIVVEAGMPGVGFPCWKVELQKVRNGKPGCWELQWQGKKFEVIEQHEEIVVNDQKRKVG